MTDDNEAIAALEAEFDNDEPMVIPITPEMMVRRLVWDIVPHEMAIATIERMDLPKVSDDVENEEHTEAHARAAMYVPLHQLVAQLSAQAAAVQLETIKQVNPEPPIDHEGLWKINFTCTKAIISELLACGYIHLPHWEVVPYEEVEFPEENPSE